MKQPTGSIDSFLSISAAKLSPSEVNRPRVFSQSGGSADLLDERSRETKREKLTIVLTTTALVKYRGTR